MHSLRISMRMKEACLYKTLVARYQARRCHGPEEHYANLQRDRSLKLHIQRWFRIKELPAIHPAHRISLDVTVQTSLITWMTFFQSVLVYCLSLARSKVFLRWYISITITIPDIIHRLMIRSKIVIVILRMVVSESLKSSAQSIWQHDTAVKKGKVDTVLN
jgi:hypothetical protein